jgi:hypothetical protein
MLHKEVWVGAGKPQAIYMCWIELFPISVIIIFFLCVANFCYTEWVRYGL